MTQRDFFNLNCLDREQFRKCKKKLQLIFRLLDNCIWKCCYKLCLLRREYLLSAPNGLKISPKIFHISQRKFLNFNCIHWDRLTWWSCCCSALKSVSVRLPSYFSKGPLKRDFLDTPLTTFFGDRKFKNPSAMRIIFFLKMFKIESKYRKGKKNSENVFNFWDNSI